MRGGQKLQEAFVRPRPSATPVFSPATKPNTVSSCRNASVNPAEGLPFTESLRPASDKQLAQILSSLGGKKNQNTHCETVKLLMTVIVSPTHILLLHTVAPEQAHRLLGGGRRTAGKPLCSLEWKQNCSEIHKTSGWSDKASGLAAKGLSTEG